MNQQACITFADSVKEHIESANKLQDLFPELEKALSLITRSFAGGNKLIIAGNGGSSSDAQHFAAELVGRFLKERRALPALALSTDGSVMTALSNDYGFETVFSRQIEAMSLPGDVFFAISTSGKSKNILNAMQTARRLGLLNIGLSKSLEKNCLFRDLSDVLIEAPGASTPRIQEMHAFVIHVLCDLIEKAVSD
jgi:D-sedoheptulose 7-phosphate isomerase